MRIWFCTSCCASLRRPGRLGGGKEGLGGAFGGLRNDKGGLGGGQSGLGCGQSGLGGGQSGLGGGQGGRPGPKSPKSPKTTQEPQEPQDDPRASRRPKNPKTTQEAPNTPKPRTETSTQHQAPNNRIGRRKSAASPTRPFCQTPLFRSTTRGIIAKTTKLQTYVGRPGHDCNKEN